jgi:hypothetical protein
MKGPSGLFSGLGGIGSFRFIPQPLNEGDCICCWTGVVGYCEAMEFGWGIIEIWTKDSVSDS